MIAWSGRDGTGDSVHVRTLSAGGTPGATGVLTPPGVEAGAPQVAVDATGVARIVYGYADPSTHEWRLRLRTRLLDGSYDAERVLSGPGQHGHSATLAAAAGGGVELAWLQHPAGEERPGPYSVTARTIRSNGTLSAAQDLGEGVTPRIVVDDHGRSAVAYQRWFTDSEPSQVVAVRRRTATTLGPIESAPARAGHGAPPAIATNPAGHVAVAWLDQAHSTLHPDGQYSRVFGRSFGP